MDILIPNSWLRDYLKTNATPKQISELLTLSGPSVEKIEKFGNETIYHIEVTSNRIDCASVFGMAREASAILTSYNIKSRLYFNKLSNLRLINKVNYLEVKVDHNLCSRFTAILIKNVQIKPSPSWLKERLIATGIRPINNVVDISNYIMRDLGQPLHTFDYDKIKKHKMILRESKKGEKVTTLDGKTHSLLGGDIVIEDGSGRLIDLAGIMGGENSAINTKTKNVLLFVQTYNPINIRKTSMSLAHRTEAAVLFEKGIDEELVYFGLQKSINLFEKLTQGKPEKKALDLYPRPFKARTLKSDINMINRIIGIDIPKPDISKILQNLGFNLKWKNKIVEITIPSFRDKDINITEDIIEEIARLYGYQKLPSQIMSGTLPNQLPNTDFNFEIKLKRIVKGYGGIEIYTLSLVPKEFLETPALKLKNPMGRDTEYLRTSLMPSLIEAALNTKNKSEAFHLFEMANIYLPQTNNLPEEKMILSGILSNTNFRYIKGIIEALLGELNIQPQFYPEDSKHFLPNQRLLIKVQNQVIGYFGNLEKNNLSYYEFSLKDIKRVSRPCNSFQAVSSYPPQIEDLTFTFPSKTYIGQVIKEIVKIKNITKVDLTDIYNQAYTFRIWYQSPTKTLTNHEVEKIRTELLQRIKKGFGGSLK